MPKTGNCDDHDPCTKDDMCSGTTCAGTSYTCDDGLVCTTDICDGQGGCLTQQTANTCLIAGACAAPGDRNPSNACQVCVAGTIWSPANDGSCDDGNTCTTNDQCAAGSCVGGPPPDDSAGDWLVELGDAEQFGTRSLVVLANGDVVFSVYASGQGELGGELFDNSTNFVVRLRADGSLLWTKPVEGLTALVSDGPSALAVFDGETRSLGSTPVAREDGNPFALVTLDDQGAVASTLHLAGTPFRRTVDGHWLARRPISGSTTIMTRTGAISVEPTSPELLFLYVGADGMVEWFRRLRSEHGAVVRDALMTRDGDLALVIGAGGDLAIGDPLAETRYAHETTQYLLVRLGSDGSVVSGRRIVSDIDWFFGRDFDQMSIRELGDGSFVVAGSVSCESATFGVAPNEVTYDGNGYLSRSGNPIGAGGDGFVARFTSGGILSWARFLTPLTAPEFDVPGARVSGVSVADDHIFVVGTASGLAQIGPISPPKYVDLLPYRGLVLSLTMDGTPSRSVIGSQLSYPAFSELPNTPGFVVLQRICAPDTDVFSGALPEPPERCAIIVERLGSAGGFGCPQ